MSFEALSNKLIELVIGLMILVSIAVALMPTIHQSLTWFIANLTSVGVSGASAVAGIIEVIVWLLVVVAIVKGVMKATKA